VRLAHTGLHDRRRTHSTADTVHAYEIRIRGRLTDTLLQAFDGMGASFKPVETVLHGPLADQAALHELLDRVQALGLELVDVRRLPDSS
jgi:hypothetical protein